MPDLKIKTSYLSWLDGLELKEAVFQNQSFPDHFHDTYSIGIIETGIEKLSLRGRQMPAHANSVIIINPYDIHANSFFDNDAWKYRILYVNGDIMRYAQAIRGGSNRQAVFPGYLLDDRRLYEMIYNFHLCPAGPESIYEILFYLLENYASEQNREDARTCTNEILDATHYIDLHYPDKVILEQLAARCKMDKFKFIRSFKKQTGLTPISYLLLQRINKAKRLIATGMPVVAIALETGFYDQSHFSHYFKKYIGISPLQYKKGMLTH